MFASQATLFSSFQVFNFQDLLSNFQFRIFQLLTFRTSNFH
eukprot:UN01824